MITDEAILGLSIHFKTGSSRHADKDTVKQGAQQRVRQQAATSFLHFTHPIPSISSSGILLLLMIGGLNRMTFCLMAGRTD